MALNVVKAVVITLLILAVIGIAIMITLPELRDVTESIDSVTVGLVNDTTDTPVNETGTYVTGTRGLRSCTLTLSIATNATGTPEDVITAANYTVTGCLITYSSPVSSVTMFNNSLWNITGSYEYADSGSYYITENISVAIGDFFTNSGTILAILIVVVIILAIAIIIAVVSRFGSGSGGGGNIGGGSGKSYGSDTVMGI